ncbi:J domain-containing protein [Pseudoalteromonas sp. SWN166]|uniref:J domain-containing protein n=1 Tax=Pseudoalteromonas sp. SWN166 TaxID=2792061 RepID=UPI0018CE2AE8|nr:J domain-containing protein [Pseudoalteromonas sp. SWN166]MBH0040624.1 DnaJ domain-containing protein [Pseudoalteromonas sp. SWN166]
MDITKDYYKVLGVLPSAERIVIKAAYKALMREYHPDVYQGEREYALRKATEINEAYEVLSSEVKRREYDEYNSQANFEFGNKNSDSELNDTIHNSLNEKWVLACKYCPDLLQVEKRLSQISSSLCFSFKVEVLETKNFSTAKLVANKMLENYVETYFGKNKDIKAFAIELIIGNKKEAARELNRVIATLGSEVDSKFIITKITEEFSHQDKNNQSLNEYLNYQVGDHISVKTIPSNGKGFLYFIYITIFIGVIYIFM